MSYYGYGPPPPWGQGVPPPQGQYPPQMMGYYPPTQIYHPGQPQHTQNLQHLVQHSPSGVEDPTAIPMVLYNGRHRSLSEVLAEVGSMPISQAISTLEQYVGQWNQQQQQLESIACHITEFLGIQRTDDNSAVQCHPHLSDFLKNNSEKKTSFQILEKPAKKHRSNRKDFVDARRRLYQASHDSRGGNTPQWACQSFVHDIVAPLVGSSTNALKTIKTHWISHSQLPINTQLSPWEIMMRASKLAVMRRAGQFGYTQADEKITQKDIERAFNLREAIPDPLPPRVQEFVARAPVTEYYDWILPPQMISPDLLLYREGQGRSEPKNRTIGTANLPRSSFPAMAFNSAGFGAGYYINEGPYMTSITEEEPLPSIKNNPEAERDVYSFLPDTPTPGPAGKKRAASQSASVASTGKPSDNLRSKSKIPIRTNTKLPSRSPRTPTLQASRKSAGKSLDSKGSGQSTVPSASESKQPGSTPRKKSKLDLSQIKQTIEHSGLADSQVWDQWQAGADMPTKATKDVKDLEMPWSFSNPLRSAVWAFIKERLRVRWIEKSTEMDKNVVDKLRDFQPDEILSTLKHCMTGLQKKDYGPEVTLETLTSAREAVRDMFEVLTLLWANVTDEYNETERAIGQLRELGISTNTQLCVCPGGLDPVHGCWITLDDLENFLVNQNRRGWLNDNCIDAALTICLSLGGYYETAHAPRCSEFFSWKQGVPNTLTTLPRTKLNLIPINYKQVHWVLGVIEYNESSIMVLDSLPDGREQRMKELEKDLKDIAYQQQKLQTHWTFTSHATEPEAFSGNQTNSRDCGIWVIQNAFSLLSSPERPRRPFRRMTASSTAMRRDWVKTIIKAIKETKHQPWVGQQVVAEAKKKGIKWEIPALTTQGKGTQGSPLHVGDLAGNLPGQK